MRALVSKSNAPEVIRRCQPIFSKLVNPQVRNTLVTDMLSLTLAQDDNNSEENTQTLYDGDSKAAKLPTDLRRCIEQKFIHSPSRAPLLSHLTIDGLTYSVSSKHIGNSCIMLDANATRILVPVQLDYIVELETDEGILTITSIQRYQPFLKR